MQNTNDYLSAKNTESFKRQAASVKPKFQASSGKHQAPSSKHQASSRKRQAARSQSPHKVSRR